jgi:hypothetical protein
VEIGHSSACVLPLKMYLTHVSENSMVGRLNVGK